MLTQVTREVTVEALPLELPEHLELDVTGLGIGDSLRIADLDAIEGVSFVDDPDDVLAAVGLPDTRGRAGGRARGGRRGRRGRGRRGCRRGGRGARGRGRRAGRARRRLDHAPVPSRRAGLDARPARRRPRQPGARVREDAAQRRMDGRGRAREAARRLVPLEVLRPAGGGPDRRPEGRAARARDLHERVRALRRARRSGSSRSPPDKS